MSVAVPRPLNSSMNPNIASRPGSSSSAIRARPSTSTAGPSGSHAGKMPIPSRPPLNSRTSSVSTSTASTPAASSTAIPSGGGSKDTSSSAGKVFAKPSKEWVLPERAKPGRKVSADEPDNNRLSQRAHRARRTDYITTLEDRLRQYEADEIHSNVRLQEVARALKLDNERMKNELMLIKAKMNELFSEKEGWETERRNLEEMCASLMSEVERLRDGMGSGLKLDPPSTARNARPSSATTISGAGVQHYPEVTTSNRPGNKRTPVACPICPDPDPDCPCQQPVQLQSPIPTPTTVPHQSACGLCTTPAECLCRVVEDNPSPSPKPLASAFGSSKTKCDVCSSLTICLCEDDTPPLPRASAAVPLSLRSRAATGTGTGTGVERVKKTFWRLDNVITKGEAVCSGDPSNCDACRDDSFGKEFCGHLFEPPSTSTSNPTNNQPVVQKKPCINCPGNCMSINNLVSPAPVPTANEGFIVHPPTPSPTLEEQEQAHQETMRCDEAWKKLKAHPNAKFASLALLADVVAGRTKCTGPTIELSPVPAHTPSPLRASSIGVGVGISATSSSVVHTHAAPVKRRMGVETSAVRDALRILDSTPSRAASELESGVGQVKTEPIDLDEVNERAVKRVRVE